MKKIILSLVFAIAVFAVNAQTKVTKASVTGKWSLTAMKVDGVLYYDVDKDSVAVEKETLDKVTASGQDSATFVDQMKGGLGSLKEMTFDFTEAGNYSIDGPQSEKGTFSVDEATETIIMNSKKDGKQEIKASFKNGILSLVMPGQGGPATTMLLKKSN